MLETTVYYFVYINMASMKHKDITIASQLNYTKHRQYSDNLLQRSSLGCVRLEKFKNDKNCHVLFINIFICIMCRI